MSVGGGVVRSHDVDVDQGVWLLLTAFWTCLWAFSPVLSAVHWACLNGVRAKAGLIVFYIFPFFLFWMNADAQREWRKSRADGGGGDPKNLSAL